MINFKRLTLLTLIGLGLFGCSGNQLDSLRPTASVVDTRVMGLSFDAITLGVMVDIANPNSFNIPAGLVDLGLLIDGHEITQTQFNPGAQLPARKSTQVEVPVQLPFNAIFQAASGLRNANEFNFEVKGNLAVPVPMLGDVNLPLAYQGKAPVPKAPKLSIADLVLTDIGITRSSMDLFLQIDNPNVFPILLRGMNLDLKANGMSLVNLATEAQTNIAAGQSNTIKLPLSFSTANAGLSLYQSILSSSAIQWQVAGETQVDGAYGFDLKDFNFNVNELLSAFR